MDKTSCDQGPEQLVLRDSSTSLPVKGLEASPLKPKKTPLTCYRMQINMGLLGPRLRVYAHRMGASMSVLMRRATLKMLDDDQVSSAEAAAAPFEHSSRNVHFHLYLPPPYASELTARARAADMTRGEFVWSLLKGISPPDLPPDHGPAVQALRASTDRVARLSTDLSEFLRLLTQATASRAELEPHQASIRALNETVREHMKVASVLIAELKPYRRARW